MNKTKIDWADYTWNPVTGCLHNCPYCYARKISTRFTGNFEPTFHGNRLNEPQKVKTPQKVFVCSMADLFGKWVPDSWIQEVFKACEKAPWHHYLFLTKNPKRYDELQSLLMLPRNNHFWYGTTLENQNIYETRGRELKPIPKLNYFLSLEPLQSEITFHPYTLKVISWIIIGQQTNPTIVPKDEWVQSIIDQCKEAGVPVFVKEPLCKRFSIQEYPLGLGGVK